MKKILFAGLALLALASAGGTARADDLVAAVLPSSRSGVINKPVTVFATMINVSGSDATGCTITTSQSGLTLDFQATNAVTNQPVGTPNTPVSIASNASQSFLLTFTSSVALQAVDVPLTFDCTGLTAAPIISGLDTLLLSIADSAPPDIVALALTPSGNGVVSTGSEAGTGAFVVASIDIGAGATVTVAPNTGDLTNLPVALTICQTDRAGNCMAPAAASVSTTYTTLSTATFAVFVTASGPVPFDPATTRVFVTFTDSSNVVRGKTSVALLVPATATQTNTSPGGVYVGVWRVTSAPAFPQPISAVVSQDGEFHLLPGIAVNPPFGPIMRETLQLTASPTLTLTATGNSYAAGQGTTMETGTVTATGFFSPQHTLVLTYQNGTQTGTFSLNYVPALSQEPSSLAKITGNFNLRDEAGALTGMAMINADGSFSAMTMAGCMETGTFSIIDASFSVYRVAASFAACGSTPAASFTGLSVMESLSKMNDTLTTELSNPTMAAAELFTSF
jgi:hypothetical protein